MTKFIVNNRTDSLKIDINLFFMITNGRIARSRSLTRRINFKFIYYMACSASGQDESNIALCLATRAGKIDRGILPARDYPQCPARKITPKAI